MFSACTSVGILIILIKKSLKELKEKIKIYIIIIIVPEHGKIVQASP